MPNYELLRDAHAVIHLDDVLSARGSTLTCGTIACAAGWLGIHPTFAARLKPKQDYRDPTQINWSEHPKGIHADIYDAMSDMFGISRAAAETLFTAAGHSRFDSRADANHRNHKTMFLSRVRAFLKEKGQL